MQMKANVKILKKTGIILSVGMIIRNEEKHLEKCLSALKPFLDSIKSELIIVDTGSTDASREIACRYTNKVYDFKWCDDFSAARNAGLARARGEWFMFVDADEYLDADFSEMTKFFSIPELNKKYNSASVLIRSYTEDSEKVYTDFLGSRLVRLLPGVRFEGIIHESLPMPHPHGYFSTVFHHYGYRYKSSGDRNKKFQRNLDLLRKEYAENPENLRTLSHIYDSALDKREKQDFLDKAYEIAAQQPLSMYVCCVYLNCIAFYTATDKPRAIGYAREFLGREGVKKRVSAVQASSALANLLCEIQEYEEAVGIFELYFSLYEQYHAGALDNADLRARGIKGITPVDRDMFSVSFALCLTRLERHEDALKVLSGCRIDELPASILKDTLPLLKEICINTKDYSLLGSLYLALHKKGEEDPALTLYTAMLSGIFYELKDTERARFAKAIGECGGETPLCVLMKILLLEDMPGFTEVLEDFCAVCTDWSNFMAEAVWLCMKYGVSLNKAALNMTYSNIRAIFPLLCSQHDEFPETALAYTEIFSVESMRDLFLLCSMLETAALGAAEAEDAVRSALYNLFTSALGDYVLNLYNNELFNEDDIHILPPLHRFGYYMAQAHINTDNPTEYIKNLRNALKSAAETKDIIAFMMDEYAEAHMNKSEEGDAKES